VITLTLKTYYCACGLERCDGDGSDCGSFVNERGTPMESAEYLEYRGTLIERHPTGWLSAFVMGHGFLKADSLAGIMELIDTHQ